MTYANPSPDRSRWLRIALAAVLVAVLAVGVYLVWPSRTGDRCRRPRASTRSRAANARD